MSTAIESELLDHWTSAVRVTQRLVDSREDAEDCASAAVLQLLEQGNAIDNPQAFLLTVAKRRAADKSRSSTRARRRDGRLAAQPPTAVDVAEDVASRAEALWVTKVARENLSPKAFRLLRLLADGHDIREAAVALGISQRGAESLLLRARRTVRHAWSKTLVLLGGFVLLGRRLRVAAPAVTLAASVLVVTVGPGADSSLPAPSAPEVAAPVTGSSEVSLLLAANRRRPLTPVARPAALTPHRAQPAARSRTVVDVRPPTGGRAMVSEKERPGGSGEPVDTVQRCLRDLRISRDHIGC